MTTIRKREPLWFARVAGLAAGALAAAAVLYCGTAHAQELTQAELEQEALDVMTVRMADIAAGNLPFFEDKDGKAATMIVGLAMMPTPPGPVDPKEQQARQFSRAWVTSMAINGVREAKVNMLTRILIAGGSCPKPLWLKSLGEKVGADVTCADGTVWSFPAPLTDHTTKPVRKVTPLLDMLKGKVVDLYQRVTK
jgi:hypothetical protein